jgi:hypothetical protein
MELVVLKVYSVMVENMKAENEMEDELEDYYVGRLMEKIDSYNSPMDFSFSHYELRIPQS